MFIKNYISPDVLLHYCSIVSIIPIKPSIIQITKFNLEIKLVNFSYEYKKRKKGSLLFSYSLVSVVYRGLIFSSHSHMERMDLKLNIILFCFLTINAAFHDPIGKQL